MGHDMHAHLRSEVHTYLGRPHFPPGGCRELPAHGEKHSGTDRRGQAAKAVLNAFLIYR